MQDDEFRGLQEQAQLVRDMASHPGWTVVYARAREAILLRQQAINSGSAKSYEEYKSIVAWTDGLEFCMKLPEAIEKELDTELARRAEEEE